MTAVEVAVVGQALLVPSLCRVPHAGTTVTTPSTELGEQNHQQQPLQSCQIILPIDRIN